MFEHGCESEDVSQTSKKETIDRINDLEQIIQKQNAKIDIIIEKLKKYECITNNPDTSEILELEAPFKEASTDINLDDVLIRKDNQFKCDKCDFKTDKNRGLSIHKSKKHRIDNPTYSEYFIDDTTTECNKMYKNSQKVGEKQIMHLHSKECWESAHPCKIYFERDHKGHASIDKDGVVHVLLNNYISHSIIDWDQLYIVMVGFDLERLWLINNVFIVLGCNTWSWKASRKSSNYALFWNITIYYINLVLVVLSIFGLFLVGFVAEPFELYF